MVGGGCCKVNRSVVAAGLSNFSAKLNFKIRLDLADNACMHAGTVWSCAVVFGSTLR